MGTANGDLRPRTQELFIYESNKSCFAQQHAIRNLYVSTDSRLQTYIAAEDAYVAELYAEGIVYGYIIHSSVTIVLYTQLQTLQLL